MLLAYTYVLVPYAQGIVVLVLVVGFFVVRYLRAERRKRFVKRCVAVKGLLTLYRP